MKNRIKKALIASLISTIALMIWGILYWQVIYEPLGIYHTLPDGDGVAEILQNSGTQTGTYFYPWPRNTPEAMDQFVAKHTEGPFFKLSYIREGVNPQTPIKMIKGGLHFLIVSLLACGLIIVADPSRLSLKQKMLMIFLAGSIGTVFIQLGDPIWFHLPWDYSLGILVNELVSWIIMGAVIGSIIKE